MNDFMYYNPVRVHFGADAMSCLPEELGKFGPNVLLTYGGGSIRRTGLYDRVTDALRAAGKNIFELSGIMPNPRTEKVYEGIELCRKHKIDLILAVGGGSTIDCSKAIAVGAPAEGDFWEKFYVNWETAETGIPLGVILTIPATGSELDKSAVITNFATGEKNCYDSEWEFPRFAILDPTLTYSLPKNQMVNGIVDTMSHLMELYISPPDDGFLTDNLAEAAMRTEIAAARRAVEEPTDYEVSCGRAASRFAACSITGKKPTGRATALSIRSLRSSMWRTSRGLRSYTRRISNISARAACRVSPGLPGTSGVWIPPVRARASRRRRVSPR